MHLLRLLLFICLVTSCSKDSDPDPDPAPVVLYFPPIGTSEWETVSPASLKWNTSKIADLEAFLEASDSRALIVLKDGKIVLEKYRGKQFDNETDIDVNSNWYWASAGKTITAAIIGIAEEQNLIDLDEKTSTYLGTGWTSLTPEEENNITVRHQLTMTIGLDDDVPNRDCTDPECFTFKAAPGTRWAYHNAPYTLLLDDVIPNATGKTLNVYLNEVLKSKTGMDGLYLRTGDNIVFYGTARSMARFGLLLLNNGKWGDTQVIPEAFVTLMKTSSQNFNPSYGYLTWLNGKASYILPNTQISIPNSISPSAPADMFAAMGKHGQIINVVPSQNLVVVRMGDSPDTSLVPLTFQNDLWKKLNEIIPN